MRKIKFLGLFLFLISLTLIVYGNFSITGGIIGFNQNITINILGLTLLLISVMLMTSKKSLEAIVIPTGKKEESKERAKVGRDYYSKLKDQYFIISGGPGSGPLKESERAEIYRELRGAGYKGGPGFGTIIKPSQITIEGRSKDNLDNVVYSLEKLRPGTKRMDFVSYPMHLEKIKYIMKKAREKGLVPEGLKVKYIPTSQSPTEFLYGILALLKEKYRLRYGIKEAQKHHTGKVGNLIKKIIEG